MSTSSGTAVFIYGHLEHAGSAIQDAGTFNNRTHGDMMLRYEPDSAQLITDPPAGSIALSGPALISQAGSGVPLTPRLSERTIRPDESFRVLFRLRADGAAFNATCGVQLTGTDGWSPTITAHTGDSLSFIASYVNVGSVEQLDIVLKNEWPDGLRYLEVPRGFDAGRRTTDRRRNRRGRDKYRSLSARRRRAPHLPGHHFRHATRHTDQPGVHRNRQRMDRNLDHHLRPLAHPPDRPDSTTWVDGADPAIGAMQAHLRSGSRHIAGH
ncbi:hypothetical protein [Nocardia nova]|uniref:hypothetical protein n=1 Tax=Nocardia nova TaxID=37330 RepID=UPI0033D7FBA7